MVGKFTRFFIALLVAEHAYLVCQTNDLDDIHDIYARREHGEVIQKQTLNEAQKFCFDTFQLPKDQIPLILG